MNLGVAERKKWSDAAVEEIKSLHKSKTWTLTELPPGRKAIECKWVFKMKYDSNGKVFRHKARLVTKGYMQKFGVDYNNTFAPVAKHATLRTLLTVAQARELEVRHYDVDSAFLFGDIEEELYMTQPEGFGEPGKEYLVCRLDQAIYGLKQSARCWNEKINKELIRLDYKQSQAGLYSKRTDGKWNYAPPVCR